MNARHDAPRTQRERQRQFSHDGWNFVVVYYCSTYYKAVRVGGGG
jgi:hypothetical protein